MRIRRAFGIDSLFGNDRSQSWIFTALPIIYARNRDIIVPELCTNNHEKSLTLGSIFNIRVTTKDHWWLEITTGLENQSAHSCGTNNFFISKTGLDDIVISLGKNILINDDTQLVLYALAGFPVNQHVTQQEKQTQLLGTKFFGLGTGFEYSYSVIRTLPRALLLFIQARFVHFFDRGWFPILPCDARIQPGNITDIFFITQYREHANILEVGYNATFFTNQGVLFQIGKTSTKNFLRNSFYANYMHIFKDRLLFSLPGALGIGFNIGRENRFKTKITAGWLNISLLY